MAAVGRVVSLGYGYHSFLCVVFRRGGLKKASCPFYYPHHKKSKIAKRFRKIFCGASRIAGFGEGTPQQDLPQGQNRRYADFGTVVESCSKKLPLSSTADFAAIRRGAAWLVSVNIAITAACPAHLCSPLRTETENAKRSFGFFITTTVGKPGLGKMDAKKVAGFQKISAAHGSSLFSFCFHSKGGATAF